MKKAHKETWKEETLRLLNEGEHGEALKMFRQKHKMVNRFVCNECGNVQSTLSSVAGCTECGSIYVPTKVIIEEPSIKLIITKVAWWLFQIAAITYFMIAAIWVNSEKREKIGYLKGRIDLYNELMENAERIESEQRVKP